MTEYECPVEGCNYGASDEKSLPAVRSHINASSDDEHDWGELKEIVEQQESAEEQDEPAKSEEDETTKSSDEEEEMPTEEEYEAQHGDGSSTEGTTESADETNKEESEESSGGLPLPALSGSTVMVLVAVLGVIILLYVVLNRGDDGVEHADAVEQQESTDDSGQDAVSNEEVSLLE